MSDDAARKAKAREWQQETLRLALDLDPEHRAALRQLEDDARGRVRDDPAMKAVYKILARQMQMNEEGAAQLYEDLAAAEEDEEEDEGVEGEIEDEEGEDEKEEGQEEAEEGGEDVEDEEESTSSAKPTEILDKDKPASNPPTPPPSILPPPPSDPPISAPIPPPPTLNPPPNPPPQPPQGAKRPHSFSAHPHPAKKPRFAPAVGDWKCGKCSFWNFRTTWRCQGRGCDIDFTMNNKYKRRHEVQQAGPEIAPPRRTAAREWGDWQCECRIWNRPHWGTCWKCGVAARICEIGRDRHDDLPVVDRTPSMPASADYWGGGGARYSSSVQHGYETAGHLGVLGKKKHSWEKKG